MAQSRLQFVKQKISAFTVKMMTLLTQLFIQSLIPRSIRALVMICLAAIKSLRLQ